MSDAAAAPAPVKKTPKKAGKPKKPMSHPPVSNMVCAAIKALKERNGSSPAAIKKYIAANYKGTEKLNTFINKCLKSGVEKKVFVQTKGTGASGRFKLAVKGEKPTVAKKPKTKKTPKKAAKKPVAAKKPAAKKTPKKAAKKPVAKKPAAKKPAAKKPAAKKPAAKKPAAKKPAAKKPAKKAAKK